MNSTKRWWRLSGLLPRTSPQAQVAAAVVASEVAWEAPTTILAMTMATLVPGLVVVATAMVRMWTGAMVEGAEVVMQAMELQVMAMVVAMVQE
jgi:uncharacterized membrane protein (GlpM family)